jgi:hypothetical protein
MVARLSIAVVSIAALVSLAAACGGNNKAPSRTATSEVTAQSTTAPTPTLRYASSVRPISESDAAWKEIANRVSANLSPVLQPPSPPEGFDTMQVYLNDNSFEVHYSGPNKKLGMLVGALSNPGLLTSAGHQERVDLPGVACVEGSKPGCPLLQVKNDANPTEFSFLLWYEPGHEVFPDAPSRDSVEYYITGEGVEPQFLIDFAKSLTAQVAPLPTSPP